MGLIIDLFAGGGGTSLGIEMALGRSPDAAVNHSAEALAMHEANHHATEHLRGDVWHYAPRDVARGRVVELLWASPTCTHFSKAKGGALRDAKIRALAWVVVRWAREAKPRVICVENVEEFQGWGPLANDGTPCPRRKGRTFQRWIGALRGARYTVEWRELRACDYGAPTTRKRLFVIARCDGQPIVWPAPTHGPGRLPYRSAASCIDFSLPCPSIFDRARPLAEATLRRIARGVRKFVLESAAPFIVPVSHGGDERVHDVADPVRTITASSRSPFGLIAPTLIHQSNGERVGQAFLAKHYGGNESPGSDLRAPIGTITAQDHHHLVEVRTGGDRREHVRAFLAKFNGTSTGQEAQLSLGTVTAGGWKHGLVTVHGEAYEIADIGMRMLTPRELFRAQGFPDSYAIDPVVAGRPLSKTAQIRAVGNSVAPHVAAAIVRANLHRHHSIVAA